MAGAGRVSAQTATSANENEGEGESTVARGLDSLGDEPQVQEITQYSVWNYVQSGLAKCMDCFAGLSRLSCGADKIQNEDQFFDGTSTVDGLISPQDADSYDFGVGMPCSFALEGSNMQHGEAEGLPSPGPPDQCICCDSSMCRSALRIPKGVVVEARKVRSQRIVGCSGASLMHWRVGSTRVPLRMRVPRLLSTYEVAPVSSCLENAATQFLGGGRRKKGTTTDPLLLALTEVLHKFEHANPANKEREQAGGKQSLRDALAKAVARPTSGRDLLNKLKSIIRAAEGGHLFLDGQNTVSRHRLPSDKSLNPPADSSPDVPAPCVGPGQPAVKSILKPAMTKASALLTERASDVNPLADCQLRSEDWPRALVMRAPAVLAKLRRGEVPAAKPVACIMSEAEAEECMAYWLQHKLSSLAAASLTCVVGDRLPSVVAWAAPSKEGVAVSSQWLSFLRGDRTSVQTVRLLKLGADTAPRNPLVKQPEGAKIPQKKDVETVRLTVFSKYTAEKLSSQFADALLKKIWPTGARSASNFANWRLEKNQAGETVALTSYVAGSKAVVDGLLAKSGSTPLFVSRLAKDKIDDAKVHPFWVPRALGMSDCEYLESARQARVEAKCVTGLMHRLGGGKDLGFMRPVIDVDPQRMPPFFWHAFAPSFWTAEDLLAFLESTGWEAPEVLGQAGKAWRFKASKRPAKETSFIYDLQPDGMLKIVPQPRKVEAPRHLGKSVGRPRAPWESATSKEQSAKPMQVDEGPEAKDAGQPSAKRAKVAPLAFGEQLSVTDESCPLHSWHVVEAGGEGACGYRALIAASIFDAKADSVLNQQDVFKQAASLRVATARHIRQHPSRFEPSWGVDPAKIEHTGESWTEYLDKLEDPSFYMDEIQLRAVAEKLKRKVTVFYLDAQKNWSRRVFNARAEGQPLVLLLKNEHYRVVKVMSSGFPAEWNKSHGGSFPAQGGGAKSAKSSCNASVKSCSTFKVRHDGQASKAPSSCSTFKVAVETPRPQTVSSSVRRGHSMPGSFGCQRPSSSGQAYDPDAPWVKGALYRCPCGWQLNEAPDIIPRKLASQRIVAFVRHWQECRPGEPMPALSAKQRQQKVQDMADKASLARSRIAWSAWCNLKQILPSKVFANLHELEEQPVNLHDKPRGATFMRPCKRCDGVYSLGYARTVSCPATAPALKMTCHAVEAAVREAEGPRTKRAMQITADYDARPSSRRSFRNLSAAEAAKARADSLRRGIQVSHVRK